MSNDEPLEVKIPTAPNADVDDGIVTTAKQFSDVLTLDLTDEEIGQAFETIVSLKRKYQQKWHAMDFSRMERIADELEIFRDEVTTTLAERHSILATVDGTPVMAGEPPVIEIMGRIPGTAFDQYGMDHEKKEWEVKQATNRGEDYLGQKG